MRPNGWRLSCRVDWFRLYYPDLRSRAMIISLTLYRTRANSIRQRSICQLEPPVRLAEVDGREAARTQFETDNLPNYFASREQSDPIFTLHS
jgi:hypothetical protein